MVDRNNTLYRVRPGECWEWQGGIQSKGYGSIGLGDGTTALAHRVAYELTKGNIPESLCVMHACDNRLCCNPRHLIVGTISENNQDMINKNRHAHGINVGSAKFTPEMIVRMRSDYQTREKSIKQLSEEL